MRVSRNWLQRFFASPLPPAQAIADLLTVHSFEIEGVEAHEGDEVIEVDVLANRGSDCLCHRGIAKEIAVMGNIPFKNDPLKEEAHLPFSPDAPCGTVIRAEEGVHRLSAVLIRGVRVGPSPEWLVRLLAAVGQRSINNVVDATNFVMLHLGQPLHAFDAQKLEGETKILEARWARAGEEVTVLTGETYTLTEKDLVIADGTSDTALAIAGIKGGAHAEVREDTEDIVVEAANFHYATIRKTAQRIKLHTDASHRFQHQPVPQLTAYALREVIALIRTLAGGTLAGASDTYPHPYHPPQVTFALEDVAALLGAPLGVSEVNEILYRFGWEFQEQRGRYTVATPFERRDLTGPEDVVEEIGRAYGYENITSLPLPPLPHAPHTQKRRYYEERVGTFLAQRGFSEIYTYPLADQGAVALANALAADKNHLRASLLPAMARALERNAYYAPLLGLEVISLFEIGTVWRGLRKDGSGAEEEVMLSLGVAFPKKKKGRTPEGEISEALEALAAHLGTALPEPQWRGAAAELSFDALLDALPEPDAYEPAGVDSAETRFRPPSPYPFVLRDIAVWVPEGTAAEAVAEIIRRIGGDILVRCDLFDTFPKDGRCSFAFHLVFQSDERTLTDEEVNTIMDRIAAAMVREGWEVR